MRLLGKLFRRKTGVLVAALAVLAIGLIAAGCPAEEASEGDGKTVVTNQEERVAAAEKIDELRGMDPPDFEGIETEWNDTLKGTAEKRDESNGTTMVADIEAAIAAGKAGEDQGVNGQIVAKTLDRVFYLSVKSELAEVKELFDDKGDEGAVHKWDEAEAYYAGTGADVNDDVARAFKEGRKSILDDDLLAVEIFSQDIDKNIISHFANKIVAEAEDAQAATDEGEAAEKLTEGIIFYSIIADKFPAQDAEIMEALSSVETYIPETVSSLLAQGFSDKVVSEANEAILPANWGENKAAIVAHEAGLYAAALESVKGGEEAIDVRGLKASIAALKAAVENEELAAAEGHVADINEAVGELVL